MAYAYFTVHQPMGLWPIQNLGEMAAMNAWVFLAIAVLGPGPWSLDAVLWRTRTRPSGGSHTM
jgi:putative oxidoreductase